MADATKREDDFDAGFEKPKSNMWKPGKPGDRFKGVLLGSKTFEGKYGPAVSYEFRAIAGEYHDIEQNEAGEDVISAEAAPVVEGENYAIIERSTFADDIKKAKIGQQVVIRFLELRKPKSGGKPYKMVECKLGTMDPEYAKANPTPEQAAEQAFE